MVVMAASALTFGYHYPKYITHAAEAEAVITRESTAFVRVRGQSEVAIAARRQLKQVHVEFCYYL